MKSQWKVLALLAVTLAMVVAYGCQEEELVFNLSLTKPDLRGWLRSDSTACTAEEVAETTAIPADMTEHVTETAIDSAHQTILFFGDSMLEGLSRRFADYAVQNGHELYTVIWYSSSTQQWAETDTLQYFMQTYKPTFLVMCIGSNELFVKDLSRRDTYIKEIVRKIGDTPYVWISPPNWKDDTGINDLIIRNIGPRHYFDSRHLELARKRDHAHPTFPAAAIWMDSVAVWMSSQRSQHPILMDFPEQDVKLENLTLLLPPQ